MTFNFEKTLHNLVDGIGSEDYETFFPIKDEIITELRYREYQLLAKKLNEIIEISRYTKHPLVDYKPSDVLDTLEKMKSVIQQIENQKHIELINIPFTAIKLLVEELTHLPVNQNPEVIAIFIHHIITINAEDHLCYQQF
jgi:hypothetical protein